MISEALYKQFVTNHVCDYLEAQRRKFNPYKITQGFESLGLAEKIIYCNDMSKRFEDLKLVTLDDCVADVLKEIKDSFVPQLESHRIKVKALEEDMNRELSAIDAEKSRRIAEKNKEIQDRYDALMASMADVVKKHETLIELKPELENVFKIYGLSTTRVQVSYETATLEDLSEAIDIATVACRATVQNKDLFSRATSLLYLPAVVKLEDENTQALFRYSWIISLLILGIFAKPYFFGGVGLLYLISMFGNIYKVKEKEELLYLAYSLTDSLDFSKFIDQDELYVQLHEELELIHMEDLTLPKLEVKEKYDKLLAELDKENPKHRLDEEERAYVTALDEIREECEQAELEVMRELKALITSYQMQLDHIREHFKEMHDNTVFLGDEVSRSKVLSTMFKLGVGKFEGQPVTEAMINMPLKNILFTYKNEAEKMEHTKFLKLLLCNALCNVKEKHLSVTIYDSHGLGKDFAEFYDNDLSQIIKTLNKDFRKLTDELIENSTKNIKIFGNKTIQEFNEEAQNSGKVTKDYNLVIILSTEENIYNNTVLRQFLEYSASVGTWVWLMSPDEMTIEERDRDSCINFYKGLPRSTTPGEIVYDDRAIGAFRDPVEKYVYDYDLGNRTVRSLIRAIEENRVEILDYETGFRQTVIPDEKIWTYSTIKGIELNFGYQDGDPTKPHVAVLGDGNVHGLGGGTTGAGKSAMVDMLLASLLHKYSPEQLEMVMIDFKNAEFKKYTDEYLIPHAKIIAGTKDGEYAISVFDYLIEEMERRTRLFGEYKLRNIEEYNNHMIALGRDKDCLPRIMVLIDEYQVMFTEVDDKSLDIIKKRITSLAKLARFCGCHMYFISQSMKGTMPPDIMDQFTLRTALRGSADMSQDLIGSKAASEIKEKQGYMYSNASGGADQSTTKFWRLPYASLDYIKEYMPRLINRGKAGGHINRQADFYDEKKVHKGTELTDWLNKLPPILEKANESIHPLFLLGERTSYSTNRLPNHFKLLKEENENVVCAGFERNSVLNLVNTFLENVKFKDGSNVIVNCGDKDSAILLDLENRVADKFKPVVLEKDTDLVLQIIENVVNKRLEDPTKDYSAFYFFAVYWDSIDGVGVGDTYRMLDRLKTIMRKAGTVNVHFLFFVKSFKEMARSLKGVINHKIVSYVDDNDSLALLDTSKASKIGKEFAIYSYGSHTFKFKIYDFPLVGELEKREVVLTY